MSHSVIQQENYLKHLLRHRFLFFCSTSACAFLNSSIRFNSFLSIIESDMRVHIHCDRYIRMPHEVLQRLGIHSRFCHIRTIRVSAYMRCDVWHLHPVDVIVSADHMIESVLPMHCHKWHSIIIVKQKSAISVYGLLHFRCISILNNRLKHLCHILCDWHIPVSGDY